MQDLVIIGAGGFGREMVEHINMINREVGPTWNFIGYVDDSSVETKEGVKILGGLEDFLKMDRKIQYFIAIANMEVREKIADRCKEAGFTAATIIHAGTLVAPGCEIGEGAFVGRGNVLRRNVKIGEHCIVQGGGVFCRNTQIGAYTSIMTASCVGSDVKIGKYNYFGLRCNVADGVTTADNCTFGACASVNEDAPVPGMYVGVPAVLKKPLIK